MMQIFITGHTGMLGSAVLQEARHRGHSVWASEIEHLHLESIQYPSTAVVINCIGAIPIGKRQGSAMIYANSVIPFKLAELCQKHEVKLIHISTDCVFSGAALLPHETFNPTDSADLYGSSKALGEKITSLGATVARTSFIGIRHGLLRWLYENRAEEIQGYERASWTGSTVWEVAKGILDLVEKPEKKPIEHISTKTIWNKYQVLCRLNELLDLGAKIVPVQNSVINRALIPTIEIDDLNDRFVATRLLEEWQK